MALSRLAYRLDDAVIAPERMRSAAWAVSLMLALVIAIAFGEPIGACQDRPVAHNLQARHFTPQAPNKVWGGDITQTPTGEGWLYVAIVLELFNHKVVGWSIKQRMPVYACPATAAASTPAARWLPRLPSRA